MKLLTAPWVVPVSGPPQRQGAILVLGDRIVGVGKREEITVPPAAKVIHFEDCALTPALVNAHTHLELSCLGEVEGSPDFVGWIKEVIRLKKTATPADYSHSALTGGALCRSLGQALVADVVSTPESASCLHPGDGLILAQGEVISGTDAGAVDAQKRTENLLSLAQNPSAYFPHTPYTVGQAAYALAGGESRKRFSRYFTHLAESEEEIEFCMTGKGPIVDRLYAGMPVLPPSPPMEHPLEMLDKLGLVGDFSIFVHAVHLLERHVDLLAQKKAGVVLCPRSNRNLKVGVAPGRKILDRGIRVALGTDSLLSGGDLDLWKDILLAIDDYGFSPEEALRAATMGGAGVLGFAGEFGSLSYGARAAILAVRLGPGADLWEQLANSPERFNAATGDEI